MGTPTLRANALTTLEALKQFLGVSDTDTSSDGVLVQLINQASASIERALGRKLRRTTYTERIKGTANQYILVENYPVNAVEYIKQAGEVIDPGLYDFTSRSNAGVIYKDDGWPYAGYPHGLTGDSITASRNLEVRYEAGYTLPSDVTTGYPCDLPADLEGLCQEMVQYAFGKLQTGGSAGLKSFSISDVRWEWSTDTPATWQEIINEHKRVWV
ncbi:MAG: head-tail connector protein [Oscillibacter sp.]